MGGVSTFSRRDDFTSRPAVSFSPPRNVIWYFVPIGKIPFGANVPLRLLSQMNWPSIAGVKTSGETAATFPISSACTISVANRSSKVLVGSSWREGRRSWTARSSAKVVTTREKISANQNDRIILGRETTTALRSQFNLIRRQRNSVKIQLARFPSDAKRLAPPRRRGGTGRRAGLKIQ